MRLLLVDDSDLARDLVITLLEEVEANVELTWRGTSQAGFEALASGDYDVCLLDHQLGADSGLDFLRTAQSLKLRTPIIMLTGNATKALDLEAMRAGASDFLVKGDFS
ncbi:MAG TPA: response regulator, partial [Archangium sp.]